MPDPGRGSAHAQGRRRPAGVGLGERLGIASVDAAPPGVNEYFTEDELNVTRAGAILQVRHFASVLGPHTYTFTPGARVRRLSSWRDVAGADQGPAAVALELPDGVRVGLLPFEIQAASPQLLQLARRDQWTALFEWVSGAPLPCRVASGVNVYPQLFVPSDEGTLAGGDTLLALANLSADDQTVTLTGPALAGAAKAERLQENGTWIPEGDPTHLPVAAWSLTVLRF